MNELEVIVFSPTLEPLGPINQMTAITWTERVYEYGGFELWAPLTPENAELLKQKNLLWIGDTALGVIETIKKEKDEEGGLTLELSGRFSESWMGKRVILPRIIYNGTVVNCVRKAVNDNCIVTSAARKIPGFQLHSNQSGLNTPVIDINVHRDELWEYIIGLCQQYSIIPFNSFDNATKKVSFCLRRAEDRTKNSTHTDKVVLSSELSDILSSSYSSDITDYKNTAIVAGAGEGESRKQYIVNNENTGLDRIELSVDARDIADTEPWDRVTTVYKHVTGVHYYRTEEGERIPYEWKYTTTITKVLTHPNTGETRTTITETYEWLDTEPEDVTETEEGIEDVPFPIEVYNGFLKTRGISKLDECKKVESFGAQIRVEGPRAYTYGEDYYLGDTVTVQDEDLQIEVDAMITEVERSWDDSSYSIVLTLGIAAPTIKQLIKRG